MRSIDSGVASEAEVHVRPKRRLGRKAWAAVVAVTTIASVVALLRATPTPEPFTQSRQGLLDCGEEVRPRVGTVSDSRNETGRACFYRAYLDGLGAEFRSRTGAETEYWLVPRPGVAEVWIENSYAPWVHLAECQLEPLDDARTFAITDEGQCAGGEFAYEGWGPPSPIGWKLCWAGFSWGSCWYRLDESRDGG